MAIDLGNNPIGTEPTLEQQQQIRSAIEAIGDAPSDGEKYAMQDGEWVYVIPPPNRAYDIDSLVLFEEPSDIIPDFWTATNAAAVASVSFKSTLTSIGSYAFAVCSGLMSVTMPNSVTSIGSVAFYGCNGLTSVTIPDSVTSIGYYAFGRCSSLENVIIGSGVTTMSSNAFYVCSNLTALTVSPLNLSYSSIGGVLFDKDQTTLLQYPEGKPEATYTIPNSVETIAGNGFVNCINLTSVTIPNSVTSIGSAAFYNCISLTSVTIPDGVTSIEAGTFQRCFSLTSVIIGSGVTNIGDSVFSVCTSLNSISCLATVAPTLGTDVFLNVLATQIHVPVTATGYGTTYGGLEVVQDL